MDAPSNSQIQQYHQLVAARNEVALTKLMREKAVLWGVAFQQCSTQDQAWIARIVGNWDRAYWAD
jgi:hypothetical protein